jgi:hypothetical protein
VVNLAWQKGHFLVGFFNEDQHRESAKSKNRIWDDSNDTLAKAIFSTCGRVPVGPNSVQNARPSVDKCRNRLYRYWMTYSDFKLSDPVTSMLCPPALETTVSDELWTERLRRTELLWTGDIPPRRRWQTTRKAVTAPPLRADAMLSPVLSRWQPLVTEILSPVLSPGQP